VYREAQRGLDRLLLREHGPEGEHDLRDLPREVAGQLHPAALGEEIDDGQVEAQAAQGGVGLGASSSDVDDVAAAPQQRGQGVARLDVPVDE